MKALTLKQRAQIINITPSRLCRIASCRLNARGDLAKQIADLTKTELALWLVGGTGTPNARREALAGLGLEEK